MAQGKYAEKLKDPRWQKKRLEILAERDWTCESCGDEKEELHVHHLVYFPHRQPWDYPSICYVVLCRICHDKYRADIIKIGRSDLDDIADLIHAIDEEGLNLGDVCCIKCGLHYFFRQAPRLLPPTYSAVIEWALSDPTMISLMVEGYLEHLDRTNRKNLADLERRSIQEGLVSKIGLMNGETTIHPRTQP